MSNLNKIKDLTNSLSRVESNLKEEKDILEFILEQATDGYWDWDMVTNYEYLSAKFKEQLGYGIDEMENKPESWQTICNQEDLQRAWGFIQSELFTDKTDEFVEHLRFTHKMGHQVEILCRGKVIKRDDSGLPLRMIGTHTIINKTNH
jgi:PAS domain S-box-containing protein